MQKEQQEAEELVRFIRSSAARAKELDAVIEKGKRELEKLGRVIACKKPERCWCKECYGEMGRDSSYPFLTASL